MAMLPDSPSSCDNNNNDTGTSARHRGRMVPRPWRRILRRSPVENSTGGVEVTSNPEHQPPPPSEESLRAPTGETTALAVPENEPNHGVVSTSNHNNDQEESSAQAETKEDGNAKGNSRLRKAGAAVGGGALMTVGAVIMVTPLHPIGHAMFLGGGYIVGSEFEGARKLKNRIFRRGHKSDDTDTAASATAAGVTTTTTPDTSDGEEEASDNALGDPSKEEAGVGFLMEAEGEEGVSTIDPLAGNDSSSSEEEIGKLEATAEKSNGGTSLVELSKSSETEAISAR